MGRQEKQDSMLSSKSTTEKSPITPLNQQSDKKSFGIGFEAGVINMQKYQASFASNKQSAEGKRQQVPPSVAGALASTSNQQQLALANSISQHNTKSIDDYKTQISNQIKIIKQGAKSGMPHERNLVEPKSPKNTWHVSFKKVAADRQPQMNYQEVFNSRSEASPIGNREVNSFGTAQRQVDYLHPDYSYDNQSASNVPVYPRGKLESGADSHHPKLVNPSESKGFLPSIDQKSMQQNPTTAASNAKRSVSNLRNFDDKIASHIQSAQNRNYQMSQGDVDPRAEASLMSAGSHPSRSVRHEKSSKLRDGANQQRIVQQASNHKQLSKRSSQVLHPSSTRNQGSVSLDPRATQNFNMSQFKDKQERQLEDLNETLQRLAREKYTKNTPGGAGGLQGGKRKRQPDAHMNQNMGGILGQIGFDPNNVLKQFDPIAAQLAEINAAVQARKEKKKKKAPKPTEKSDKTQKQQESKNFIGDALVNQRLQGVTGTEKARDKQPSPMIPSGKKPREHEPELKPNIQIAEDDPLVLKNANIVKATQQFGQTQQMTGLSTGTKRYPYNLIHSDAEDSSPDAFLHHKSPTKVSAFDLQSSPNHKKHYMTQGKGFDLMAGGQKFNLETASINSPGAMPSPQKLINLNQVHSAQKSGLKLNTQQFSSVIEDDNEQVSSPLYKDPVDVMANIAIARQAALNHQNSAEAIRDSKMRQSHGNNNMNATQRPIINVQQPQVTKAQIIEQIKQLYSSPKKISGIQLIKCEAEDIDNDVSNQDHDQISENLIVERPFNEPARQSMNQISPRNEALAEMVGSKPMSANDLNDLRIKGGTQSVEDSVSSEKPELEDELNQVIVNHNITSAVASRDLSVNSHDKDHQRIYIGESNLNHQDTLAPPVISISNAQSAANSARREGSEMSSRNSQSYTSKHLSPDKPPKGISRNHTLSLDTNSLASKGKRNSQKPTLISLGAKKSVPDSGRGSSRNSKQGKESISATKDVPLPPKKGLEKSKTSTLESPPRRQRDQNSKERIDSSRPQNHSNIKAASSKNLEQKPSSMKVTEQKAITSPKPTQVSPVKPSMQSPSKKTDKPSSILQKEPRRTNKARENPASFNLMSQRTTPAPVIKEVDDGYVSSDTPESAWNVQVGLKVNRDNYSYCSEYVMMRGNYTKRMSKESKQLFTKRRYYKYNKRDVDGDMVTIAQPEVEEEPNLTWSQRLFLSRECVISEDRRRLPVLIVNVDGVLGYWDDSNKFYFVLRTKIVESLIQLSYDFRLVAVSSQRVKSLNKVIVALMNIPAGGEAPSGGDANNVTSLRHLIFDAVYQLRSQKQDAKFGNHLKNVDEIHFDLSQVLLDMQFKPHKKEAKFNSHEKEKEFQTFWETESYRPWQKVIILTTERDMLHSKCYSFDYNYLYSAQKFRYEECRNVPIIIQVPHLRLQPRQSFEPVLQLIFGIQAIALAKSQRRQPDKKIVDGQYIINPDLDAYECCKKILTTKFKYLIGKQRKTMAVKGLRVFDQEDPFVDLEMINFCQAYTFLKWHYRGNRVLEEDEKEKRNSDWLQIKKYYLKYQPGKEPVSPSKIKQKLKVTFEESPEIRRLGDERDKASSQMRGAATAYDSSKSDRFSITKTAFTNEDAKNAYNGLMIRNYKIQQEINLYQRHYRIQSHKKIENKRKLEKIAAQEDADDSPIVIFDGDEKDRPPALKSNLKKSVQSIREILTPRIEKSYAFKYRVFKVKTRDPIEEAGEYDFSKHQVVNLQLNPVLNASVKAFEPKTPSLQLPGIKRLPNQDYKSHSFSAVMHELTKDKGRNAENQLVELLSKRQNKIGFQTNQDMHLQNNLNQLIDGVKQYQVQQQNLIDAEKDQVLSARETANVTKTDYTDKI